MDSFAHNRFVESDLPVLKQVVVRCNALVFRFGHIDLNDFQRLAALPRARQNIALRIDNLALSAKRYRQAAAFLRPDAIGRN